MSDTQKITRKSWLLLIFLSAVWGTSFILIKKGLRVYAPTEVASLRLLFSGLIMLPFVLFNLKKISWRDYKFILLFGVMNAGIPPFLFAFAQTRLPSSSAGVLNALTPLFTMMLGRFFFNHSFTTRQILGVILGLTGACIIIFMKPGNSITSFYGPAFFTFGFLIVFADLLYGASNNLNMAHLRQIPTLLIPAFAYVSMAIPTGTYLVFFSDFRDKLTHVSGAWESAGFIFILAAMGSALAMFLFSYLIKISNALFASFTTYLIPFVALLWGLIDGEPIGFVQLAGLGIIIGGIWISRK